MSVIKIFYLIIFFVIVNCTGNKVSNYHGVKLLDQKYQQIVINVTNKNDIIKLIGPPSIKSEFNNNKWFYVERLKSNQSIIKLGAQKIKKNNVLIVELTDDGILKSKKLLDITDMNDLKYLKSETNKEFQNKNPLYDVFSSLREKINAPIRKKNN
jgi:outer membrane protein assembly factor BamE (lipoprotein component of BamABCDE complex)